MEIKRFDEIEYSVLRCASPDGMGGYILNNPYKERALLLMNEGHIKTNPEEKWWESGWKLTDKGLKYWDAFIKEIRKSHGHVWRLNKESEYDPDDDSEYGNRIDIFAYSAGHHNGPVCKSCGYSTCQHCTSEFEITQKCTS